MKGKELWWKVTRPFALSVTWYEVLISYQLDDRWSSQPLSSIGHTLQRIRSRSLDSYDFVNLSLFSEKLHAVQHAGRNISHVSIRQIGIETMV